MDFRQANVLSRGGHVVAVLDWENALIGDAALELARVAEYGCLNPEFLKGYGNPEPFSQVPHLSELAYRLDAAVMLAVVFLSEAPNRNRARRCIKRVRDLCRELADTVGHGDRPGEEQTRWRDQIH